MSTCRAQRREGERSALAGLVRTRCEIVLVFMLWVVGVGIAEGSRCIQGVSMRQLFFPSRTGHYVDRVVLHLCRRE